MPDPDPATEAEPAAAPPPTTRFKIAPILGGTHTIRTGRRAEVTKEVREVRRLRAATVVFLVLAILAAPLAVYVIREATRDPVFTGLDDLNVPAWAARNPRDEANGSRWCVERCRFRQRIAQSDRPAEETSAVYTKALQRAGWRPWKVTGCPQEGLTGVETCWQRDEFVLDLWVDQPECEVKVKSPDPSAPPGSAAPAPPGTPDVEAVCPPTAVTVRVINRVAFRTGSGGPA